MTPALCLRLDLRPFLPTHYRRLLQEAADHAVRVDREGPGPGSLEDTGLRYSVVDGLTIQKDFWWLIDLYSDPRLRSWLEHLVGGPLRLSPHIQSRVNVNVLSGTGERYELHTDAQPYTLLLFGSTLPASHGGALVVQREGKEMRYQPEAGDAVFFDGARLPHAVEPLGGDIPRITVPMVFLPEEAPDRPDHLDEHLY